MGNQCRSMQRKTSRRRDLLVKVRNRLAQGLQRTNWRCLRNSLEQLSSSTNKKLKISLKQLQLLEFPKTKRLMNWLNRWGSWLHRMKNSKGFMWKRKVEMIQKNLNLLENNMPKHRSNKNKQQRTCIMISISWESPKTIELMNFKSRINN